MRKTKRQGEERGKKGRRGMKERGEEERNGN